MSQLRICILGGTGFVGGHLVQALCRQGHHVRILTRRREQHRDLLVLPNVELVNTDIHYVSELSTHFQGFDVVINLVGILNPARGTQGGFAAVHTELPGKVAEACQFNGIRRILHMSALNADQEAHSGYLRSKAAGEEAAHLAAEHGIRVTSFRPSVIFGFGDQFFNRFADLLRITPVFPLACPEARLSPVCVDDVVAAFMVALENRDTYGRRYDLCGPEVMTLHEIVAYTAHQLGLRRVVADLGDGLSRLQARLLEFVPGKPFSRDNYLSLQKDSICIGNGFSELGITPTPIAAVVPGYLGGDGRVTLYESLRTRAGRD